jgi:hypothetical protein
MILVKRKCYFIIRNMFPEVLCGVIEAGDIVIKQEWAVA